MFADCENEVDEKVKNFFTSMERFYENSMVYDPL